jgi:hypothetical protein
MTILAFVLAALVQAQVDNPEFKGWTAFKPGSSVTHKGGPQGVEQKSTLKTVGEAEVVVETEMSLGGKVMGKPLERKIPAKLAAADAPKALKEGEEEIEAGGKTLKCKWKEFEKKFGGGKTALMKVWMSEEIPGGAAKVEVAVDGTGKNTMVASAWEKK